MALLECPECLHQVSTAAKACPSCGCPIVDASLSTLPTQVGPGKLKQAESSGAEIKCNDCTNDATARCHRCQRLCCLLHIFPVRIGDSSSHRHIEQFCKDCQSKYYSDRSFSESIGMLVLIAIIIGLAFFFIAGLFR